MRFRLCVKVGSSQLGIGHIEGLCRVNTFLFAQGQFAGQVALSKVIQLIGCVYIMLAVEDDLFQLFGSNGLSRIERHSGFPNIHTQVSFYCFQGQSHLAIVHEVVLVKVYPALSKIRVFPSLMALDDNEIIDHFHLFRRIVCQNSFQNELVIVLVIEPGQKWLLFHELFDCFVVVVNYGVLSGGLVFEHEKPIKGKHLTVKDKKIIHSYRLPTVGPLLVQHPEMFLNEFLGHAHFSPEISGNSHERLYNLH